MLRRVLVSVAVLLFALSVGGNVLLGRLLWSTQKDYSTLAKQFVRVKAALTLATKPASAAAPPAQTPPPTGQTPAAASQTPAATQTAQTTAAPAAASGTDGGSPAAQAAPGPGDTALRAKYEAHLAGVQATCEGQLNDMLASARSEYQAAKKSGSKIDVAALGARYYAKADGLRRQCDRLVDAELQQLTQELRAAGLPLDLVADMRDAYDARIAERQAEVMAKSPTP